ncbi:MAG: hypothetical protein JXA04_00825 [Gammaproteobacteria bacterium]|nr:hypothetical protein [Gammaproteobacteria bacterium]
MQNLDKIRQQALSTAKTEGEAGASSMTFEEYLQFLEEYWTLFDLEEALANREQSSFHDIRL